MSLRKDINKILEALKPPKEVRFVLDDKEIDESKEEIIWVLFNIGG